MSEGLKLTLLAISLGALLFCAAACVKSDLELQGKTSNAAGTTTQDAADPAAQLSNVPHSSSGEIPQASSAAGHSGIAARTPGGTPVDTSLYDAEIKRLEQTLAKRKNDSEMQQELARAYAARAARLTEAQQYRSALGDWRRAAKLNSANEEAHTMIATITGIMRSMNRPVPAPGEEPTPLPYRKQG